MPRGVPRNFWRETRDGGFPKKTTFLESEQQRILTCVKRGLGRERRVYQTHLINKFTAVSFFSAYEHLGINPSQLYAHNPHLRSLLRRSEYMKRLLYGRAYTPYHRLPGTRYSHQGSNRSWVYCYLNECEWMTVAS